MPFVAVLKLCALAQLINDPSCTFGSNTMTVSISATPTVVSLSGRDSTSPRPIVSWRFSAVSVPSGASPNDLEQNDVAQASPQVRLQLKATGTYHLQLIAFDDLGQQSNAAGATVSVRP